MGAKIGALDGSGKKCSPITLPQWLTGEGNGPLKQVEAMDSPLPGHGNAWQTGKMTARDGMARTDSPLSHGTTVKSKGKPVCCDAGSGRQ